MDAKEKMYALIKQIQFGIELGTIRLYVVEDNGDQNIVRTIGLISDLQYAMILAETEIEK